MADRTTFGHRVKEVLHEHYTSEKLKKRRPLDDFEARHNPLEAGYAHERAEALRQLPVPLVGEGSTELMAPATSWPEKSNPRFYLLDTLENPDVISADASEHRGMLATQANVLSSALDTAKTAQAANSVEKMMCHQLAATHNAGMKLLIQIEHANMLRPMPVVETVRILNAAARMFEVYQSGCLTLQKLKTGGRQTVRVEYQQLVNVGPGGQAVVAGQLPRARKRGSRKRRGGQSK